MNSHESRVNSEDHRKTYAEQSREIIGPSHDSVDEPGGKSHARIGMPFWQQTDTCAQSSATK